MAFLVCLEPGLNGCTFLVYLGDGMLLCHFGVECVMNLPISSVQNQMFSSSSSSPFSPLNWV